MALAKDTESSLPRHVSFGAGSVRDTAENGLISTSISVPPEMGEFELLLQLNSIPTVRIWEITSMQHQVKRHGA